MSEQSAWIGDNYEEDAYIAAVDRLHPAVSFTFRPMLRAETHQAALEGARTKTDSGAADIISKWIANKVKRWDLMDDKGNVLPITTQAASRLKPRLHMRIFAIICGEDAGDARPDDLETTKPFDEGAAAKN